MIDITQEQYKWLSEHGDRGREDVKVDDKGMYVLMSNGFGKQVKVYIKIEED